MAAPKNGNDKAPQSAPAAPDAQFDKDNAKAIAAGVGPLDASVPDERTPEEIAQAEQIGQALDQVRFALERRAWFKDVELILEDETDDTPELSGVSFVVEIPGQLERAKYALLLVPGGLESVRDEEPPVSGANDKGGDAA